MCEGLGKGAPGAGRTEKAPWMRCVQGQQPGETGRGLGSPGRTSGSLKVYLQSFLLKAAGSCWRMFCGEMTSSNFCVQGIILPTGWLVSVLEGGQHGSREL